MFASAARFTTSHHDILWLAQRRQVWEALQDLSLQQKNSLQKGIQHSFFFIHKSCKLLFGNKKIWLKNLCYAIKALCLRCIINKIYEIR